MHARRLDPAQARRFLEARQLLSAGRIDQALGLAEALVAQAPDAADAWQLLGICQAEAHCRSQAIAAFERAMALLPGETTVARNFAVFLSREGNALCAHAQWQEAEPLLRRAVALQPGQASAWVDLGMALRHLGRVDEALVALRQAERLLQRGGHRSSALQDAINGVLADAGCSEQALAGARELVSRDPAYAPAHETLGQLLWENRAGLSPGEDPFDEFRAAARAQPGNWPLQLALARMLMSANRPEEVLALLHPLRRNDPGDPVLEWYAADALDALEQHAQAAQLYARVARSEQGDTPAFLNAHARHAFRTQRFDLAQHCAQRCVQLDPRDQQGWANLGTAWCLLDDEREHWLFDYERLVASIEVGIPEGFGDRQAFLQALGATLESMHGASREPINQSVRGGTQTAGRLFGRDNALLRATETALRTAIEAWLATLPDDANHPFLARRNRSVAFVGSWSVRLSSAGHHANHIHGDGWASSAFHVWLPPSVSESDDESRAGWIQCGQPPDELGLNLAPRRVLKPRAGWLVLFPSFIWHGTVPFQASTPRLTIAVDMQPGK